MNEHVHDWEWEDEDFSDVVVCECGTTMTSEEKLRRINATERLSARRVHGILEDRKLYSQDVLALHEYADTLEEKP